MSPFLIIAAVIAIIGTLIAVSIWRDRKRTAAFAEAAVDLGFEFKPATQKSVPVDLHELALFSEGHSRRLKNMLRGRTAELDVTIFDYIFSTGSGKNKSVWSQTVVCFRTGDLRLPKFSLRPETFWHRIGEYFGMQDIDFETHPQFSKSYRLKGPDVDAVRQAFTVEVLDYFDQRPGLCTEADSRVMVFYRKNKRVDAGMLREFLAEGFEVLSLFRTSAP